MASQSNQPTHSEQIPTDEDALSADVNIPLPTQLQDEYQSYNESSDEFSEDDNELYGFLQTPLISSTPHPTSSTLFISSQDNQEASIIHSPLASPSSQLAFSLPQLHIQSTTSSQHSDTNIKKHTDLIQTTIPLSQVQTSAIQVKGKRQASSQVSRQAKRLSFSYNPLSQPLKPFTTIFYIGETGDDSHTQQSPQGITQGFMPKINPKIPILPYYPEGSKDWEKRHLFDTDSIRQSPSGLARIDLKVYAIEANRETTEQIQKQSYRRRMDKMNTPIERFYPQLWDSEHHLETEHPIVLEALPFYSEPYEDAMNVLRIPEYQKFPPAILEPTQQLHPTPPAQQHSISEQGTHLLDCDDPIKFFDAIFRPYEFRTILHQTKLYRIQKKLDLPPYEWKEPTYEEIRCFIGLILWTSLVQLPNRRCYFADSKIFHLPYFKQHSSRDRFEELFTMLHFANNEEINPTLTTAERFEAKLGILLTALNTNSSNLLQPARSLSIDEIMVKFYGRSVLRQYIKAKPNKYGIKLWSICCACCGYSLAQDLYLGSTVESVGGRDVVLQLANPYLDKGHIIYCDRFFSHLDLAAYLRSRRTGMVGTSALTQLPSDLQYLVTNMHPLTWAYKWFMCQAKLKHRPKIGPTEQLQATEPVCLLVWMDKKYRTADKQVIFITNCIPAIPTSPSQQFHQKNIRDANKQYTRQHIPSPPILKAYNYRMGGVDKHDRLVGHHSIPLTSKRGYIKIFLHILDSACVNAYILYKCSKQTKQQWNSAANRKHTLAWFKESVILSLCGSFTSRIYTPSVKPVNPSRMSVDAIIQHQVQPIVKMPELKSQIRMGNCPICKVTSRTACATCKQPYCYDCGREHIKQLLMQYAPDETATYQDILMELQTHPQCLLAGNTNPTKLDDSKDYADETPDL